MNFEPKLLKKQVVFNESRFTQHLVENYALGAENVIGVPGAQIRYLNRLSVQLDVRAQMNDYTSGQILALKVLLAKHIYKKSPILANLLRHLENQMHISLKYDNTPGVRIIGHNFYPTNEIDRMSREQFERKITTYAERNDGFESLSTNTRRDILRLRAIEIEITINKDIENDLYAFFGKRFEKKLYSFDTPVDTLFNYVAYLKDYGITNLITKTEYAENTALFSPSTKDFFENQLYADAKIKEILHNRNIILNDAIMSDIVNENLIEKIGGNQINENTIKNLVEVMTKTQKDELRKQVETYERNINQHMDAINQNLNEKEQRQLEILGIDQMANDKELHNRFVRVAESPLVAKLDLFDRMQGQGSLMRIITKPLILNWDEDKRNTLPDETKAELAYLKEKNPGRTFAFGIGIHRITIKTDYRINFEPLTPHVNHHLEEMTCYGTHSSYVVDAQKRRDLVKLAHLALQMLSMATVGDWMGTKTIMDAYYVDDLNIAYIPNRNFSLERKDHFTVIPHKRLPAQYGLPDYDEANAEKWEIELL